MMIYFTLFYFPCCALYICLCVCIFFFVCNLFIDCEFTSAFVSFICVYVILVRLAVLKCIYHTNRDNLTYVDFAFTNINTHFLQSIMPWNWVNLERQSQICLFNNKHWYIQCKTAFSIIHFTCACEFISDICTIHAAQQ